MSKVSPEQHQLNLEVYGLSLGDKIRTFFDDFWKDSWMGSIEARKRTTEAMSDIPWMPIQGNEFYYNRYTRDDMKETLFNQALKEVGYKEHKKFAFELSQMSGAEAYKAMSSIDPTLTRRVRDHNFNKMQSLDVEARAEWEERGGEGEGGSFFWNPATIKKDWMSSLNKATETYFGMADQWQDIKDSIGVTYDISSAEMEQYDSFLPFLMGFVDNVPIANQLIKFEGTGVLDMHSNRGTQMMYGIGRIMSMYLQLMALSKGFSIVGSSLFSYLNQSAAKSFNISAGISRPLMITSGLFKSMGRGLISSTMYAPTYASLIGIHRVLDNLGEGKLFDQRDLDDISRGFIMGAGLGGISGFMRTAFRGMPGFFKAPLPARAIEEVAQATFVALYSLEDIIDARGYLSRENFMDIFLWELWEIAPENLIPILFGMATPMGMLGMNVKSFEAEAYQLQKLLLKSTRYDFLSPKDLDHVAKVDVINRASLWEAHHKRDITIPGWINILDDIEAEMLNQYSYNPAKMEHIKTLNRATKVLPTWKGISPKPSALGIAPTKPPVGKKPDARMVDANEFIKRPHFRKLIAFSLKQFGNISPESISKSIEKLTTYIDSPDKAPVLGYDLKFAQTQALKAVETYMNLTDVEIAPKELTNQLTQLIEEMMVYIPKDLHKDISSKIQEEYSDSWKEAKGANEEQFQPITRTLVDKIIEGEMPIKVDPYNMTKEQFNILAARGKIKPFGNAKQQISAVVRGKKPIAYLDATQETELKLARNKGLVVARIPEEYMIEGEFTKYAAFKKGNEANFRALLEVLHTRKAMLPADIKLEEYELPIKYNMDLGRVLGYKEADVMKYLADRYGHKEIIRQALQRGEQLPEFVLREYPELMKEFGIDLAKVPLPTGKIVVDGKGKIVGSVSPLRFQQLIDGLILKWTAKQFGTPYHLNELYNYEIETMIKEMQVWKSIGEGWGESRLKDLISIKKDVPAEAQVDHFLDSFRGLPIFMIEKGLWEEYQGIRTAETKRILSKQGITDDLRRMGRKHLGWRNSLDKPFKIITYYLGNPKWDISRLFEVMRERGYHITKSQLEGFTEELAAYLTSDRTSRFIDTHRTDYIEPDWVIREGLREYFEIPYYKTIKDYYPIVYMVAREMAGGRYHEAAKYIRNPHLVDRTIVSQMPLDKFLDDPYAGYKGLDIYINRSLRHKFMRTPYALMRSRLNKMEKKAGGKLSSSAEQVIERWMVSVRGLPTDADKAMINFARGTLGKVFGHLPGLKKADWSDEGIKRGFDTALSFIYAGGLGFRFSSALKNAFQGPMNIPPGMTLPWYYKGLFHTMFDPETRMQAHKAGITKALGRPYLQKGMATANARRLQKFLILFAAVDHYNNRIPIYKGSILQFDHFVNRDGILKGVENIASKQFEGVRDIWMREAIEAHHADLMYKETNDITLKEIRDTKLDKLKDQYGFLQQANSNWEYGILGRPSAWGSLKGRVAGTFLTWPTWYWGTYIPSLYKLDPTQLVQHVAKGLMLAWVFKKFIGMNLQPWLLYGTLPMRPYGPIPQVIFNALEYLKALEYGHKQWQMEALQRIKRSGQVFIPGGYAAWDFLKVFMEMKREMPYVDDRTGIFYGGGVGRARRVLTDFFGISTVQPDIMDMMEHLKNDEIEKATKLGHFWAVDKVYRDNIGRATRRPLEPRRPR